MPIFYDESGAQFDVPDAGTAASLGLSPATATTAPQAAAPAPATPLAAGKPIRMVDEQGGEFDVPDEATGAQLGLRMPEVADPNEGGLSQLATAAEGGLSGLAFAGMSQPVAALEGLGTYLGGLASQSDSPLAPAAPDLMSSLETARADMAARQEANKGTYIAANVVGGLVPAMLSGGAAAIPAIEALAARQTAAVAAKLSVDAAKIATGTLGQRIILQTVKAGIPNAIEGGAYGLAQGVDAGLQAAYAVDGELSAGDFAAVAESGAKGLGLGILVGGAFTGAVTAATETVRSVARAAGSMFGRAAAVGDDAAKVLPSGDQSVVANADAEIEAIGLQRASMLMPDSPVQPPPPVPGESLALAQLDEAALGRPQPFAKGYEPGKPLPDASKLIDDQGPLLFADAAPSDRGRAARMVDAVSESGNFEKTLEHYGKQSIDDIDELAKIVDRADTFNMLGAKRARIAAEYNTPGASFAPDARTVATIRNMADRIMGLGNDSMYELNQFGGMGKVKTMAKGVQEYANRYEAAMLEGRAGDAFMELDDLKRMFGDFSKSRNDKLSGLVTGPDGKSGLYGELKTHLEDQDVFAGLAQMQAPANSAISARISAAEDASLKNLYMKAGEKGANAFEAGQRANGSFVKQLFSTTTDWDTAKNQEAFVRYLRATANDVQARASAWGGPGAVADAARAQVLTARIEAARNAVSHAARAKDAVAAATEGVAGIGGIGQKVTDLAQRVAKSVGRKPTPAEGVAHAAVESNAAIARHAKLAAEVATGAAKKAPAATVSRVGSIAAIATLAAYARNTEPDSPDQRLRLNDAAMLAAEAPELVKPLQDLQKAKDAFIREKLGPVLASGKADAITQSKIIRYIDTSEHPEQALERISQGEARPEDVETLWKLYPSQIAKLRDQTLANIKASGKQPTREAQARLQFAFRMHDAAYLQWLQASTVPVKEETPAPVSASVSFAMPDTAGKADSLMR